MLGCWNGQSLFICCQVILYLQRMIQKNQPKRRRRRRQKRNKANKGLVPGLSRTVGQILGQLVGHPQLGASAGQIFGQVTGLGDYKVNKNSLVAGQGPPMFRPGAKSRIAHREFIGEIKGSVDFNLTTYPVNPGSALTFPWLSGIATQYESWKPHGILFEFKTTSGTAVGSTNTALGVVIAASNYNVLENSYASRREMEQAIFSTSTVPCANMLHPVECDPRDNVLDHMFVKTSSSDDRDLRFQDLANFQIATEGMQVDSKTVGELWVTYDIEFEKPRHRVAEGGMAHYAFESTVAEPLASYTPYLNNTFEINSVLKSGTFNIEVPGWYMLTARFQAGSTLTIPDRFFDIIDTDRAEYGDPDWWVSFTSSTECSNRIVATAAAWISTVVKVTQKNATFKIPVCTAISGGSTANDLIIQQIPKQDGFTVQESKESLFSLLRTQLPVESRESKLCGPQNTTCAELRRSRMKSPGADMEYDLCQPNLSRTR